MRAKPVRGRVTSYDATRGVARVRLDDGRLVPMHTGAFLSGLPPRHPARGDRVACQLSKEGRLCVVAARPVPEDG